MAASTALRRLPQLFVLAVIVALLYGLLSYCYGAFDHMRICDRLGRHHDIAQAGAAGARAGLLSRDHLALALGSRSSAGASSRRAHCFEDFAAAQPALAVLARGRRAAALCGLGSAAAS